MKPWAESFYGSKAWHDCRMAYLQSRGHLCERCSGSDDPVVATMVHHKTYLTHENISDANISLAWDNLEALCNTCHQHEHHRAARVRRYNFDDDGNLLPPIAEKFWWG